EARRRGRIENQSRFNVVDYIKGPLAIILRPDLEVILFDKNDYNVPAFVNISPKSRAPKIYVEKFVWRNAEAGGEDSRYILSHEIGHVLMHGHDELAFCGSTFSHLASLQPEERVEPQANLFADLFLVPENMASDFSCAEDIAYYFNVPIDCALRRYEHITDKSRRKKFRNYIGEACPECANFTLVRNGTCLKCDTCGSTTGCS
ncbi:MAG TPA: ImmA/IrrE family metallo-endopeptidase, partial [Methylobacterium sp.]